LAGTVLLGVVIALLVISIGWRLSSRRESIPCPAWLSWLVELDNPLFRNNRAATIIAGLEIRPGMTALDVGCGPGRLTIPLTKAVGPAGRVLALDVQAGMLERARTRAQRERLPNIEFRLANIGEGAKLESKGFDRAVLVTVLGEIPNREAALSEIFAALKPGGVLAITEVIADPHFQSRANVLALALAAGFREKSRAGTRLSYSLYLEKP
jgi:ubiquinone/menaquinone biosynthesis C-methylase UbiE